MSAVKERIRQFEERSTPQRENVTLRTMPIISSRQRARLHDSPSMTLETSYPKRPPSQRRLHSNGTPFLSPSKPQAIRTKSATKPFNIAMTDVTNLSPSTLTPPRPRRLDMIENENNNNHNDSICSEGINSKSLITPSSVQKRKEEMERRNEETRREREMRDARLGRAKTKDTMKEVVKTPPTPRETRNIDSSLELLPSPLDDEVDRDRNKKQSTARALKRFWEILYAVLALLELMTCQELREMFQMDVPKAFVPRGTVSSVHPRTQQTVSCATPFGVTEVTGYWGQNIYTVIKRKLDSEWTRRMSWQQVINNAFVLAIIIHAAMESWSIAAARNHEKQQRKQQQALACATKVTKRSKRRHQNLETTSSNRHFIMRWTRNQIRWNRTTTEIVRATLLILVFRLLFLPILKKNRIVTVKSGSRDGSLLPFISPIYVPKDGLDMTVEIAGRTLSYGESLIMDFAAWIRSLAVSHFRRKVKEFAIRFVTLALTRPWEASARVQTAFTVVRWTKFLAPLIGTCNKLRGHVADYKKKSDLKHRSERAKLLWLDVSNALRAERKADRAVRQIQRSFRSRRQRAMSQRNITERGTNMKNAVIQLQRRFRARAAESHVRLSRAKRRLSRISMGKQIISIQHRELADNLRREIRERNRKNRRLLLRPNTAFSVGWKRTTIACVLIEISYKILAPMTSPSTVKLTLDELFVHLAGRLAPLSWLQVSFVAVELISRGIAWLVSTVSFLDVFITFWTGELDEKTGLLLPKPFFARWILPGVVLQLIVNPTMKDISAVVKKMICFSNNVGPMRVLHVFVALFPIVRTAVLWFVDLVFSFVDSENKNIICSYKSKAVKV